MLMLAIVWQTISLIVIDISFDSQGFSESIDICMWNKWKEADSDDFIMEL